MRRSPLAILAILAALSPAPAAFAQFADEARPLFPAPAPVSGVVVWQFATGGDDGEEGLAGEALSAEEICCSPGEDEGGQLPFCLAAQPQCP